MDTDLIAWLVKNKNKNTTGDWVKDGHIWIKFFLPEDKCSSMCSTSDKGEELVMSVFRVKEILVLGKEILQINFSIRKMEPWFTETDQRWVFILHYFEKIIHITRKSLNVPSEVCQE